MSLTLRYVCDVEDCGWESDTILMPAQLGHAWHYLTGDGWSYVDGQLRCPEHTAEAAAKGGGDTG